MLPPRLNPSDSSAAVAALTDIKANTSGDPHGRALSRGAVSARRLAEEPGWSAATDGGGGDRLRTRGAQCALGPRPPALRRGLWREVVGRPAGGDRLLRGAAGKAHRLPLARPAGRPLLRGRARTVSDGPGD